MSVPALRPITIETGFQNFPEGSVLYASGATRVLIAVSVQEKVPSFLEGKGRGWVTADYAMHPRSTPERRDRDGRKGRVDGRSTEIQRLIGRALRAAVDLEALGPRTVQVDCDVIDADGGTRTAAISGGFVGLGLAFAKLAERGLFERKVFRAQVGALSVGWVHGKLAVDLDYVHDSQAAFDLNVVGTAAGEVIEVQGTAEDGPLPRKTVETLVDAAFGGLDTIFAAQREALAAAGVQLETLL